MGFEYHVNSATIMPLVPLKTRFRANIISPTSKTKAGLSAIHSLFLSWIASFHSQRRSKPKSKRHFQALRPFLLPYLCALVFASEAKQSRGFVFFDFWHQTILQKSIAFSTNKPNGLRKRLGHENVVKFCFK